MRRPSALALFVALILLALPSVAAAAGEPGQRRLVLLGLKRDELPLAQFVASSSNPNAYRYREFLSLGQLRRAYGAPEYVRHRVMRFLRTAPGVTSVEMGSTGTVVMATMTAAAAQRLFCARGRKPPRGRLCRPAPLRGPVRQVVAGELYRTSTKKGGGGRVARAAAAGTPSGCGAALESNTLTPSQVATAYEVDQLHRRGLEGRGIRVATLSSAHVDRREVGVWADCFGLPAPNLRQPAMPGASFDTSTAPEETYLDVEALTALAPRLARITALYVPLDTSFQSAFSLFMFGALDPGRMGGALPDLLSISDSVCESQVSAADRQLGQHLLRAAAALGITALAASGDLGFHGCQEAATGAGWPASSEYVTAVGGTEVSLEADNRLSDQTVWATFATEPPGNGVGSGGGPSVVWPRPIWQVAPGIGPALQPGTPTRLTPDLASMGSFTPGLATLGGGEGWGPGGGTSAATPLTAAVLALALEQEHAAGRPGFGALNLLLYQLAYGPGYDSIFWDVTNGTSSPRPDTDLGRSPAGGAAQVGYDLATGLGSLRATAFADAVAALR